MKIDNRKARIFKEEMAKVEIDNVAGDAWLSYPPLFNFFHLFFFCLLDHQPCCSLGNPGGRGIHCIIPRIMSGMANIEPQMVGSNPRGTRSGLTSSDYSFLKTPCFPNKINFL